MVSTYMMLSDEQLTFHGRVSVRFSHMLYHPETFGQLGLGTSVLFNLPHSWLPSMPGTDKDGGALITFLDNKGHYKKVEYGNNISFIPITIGDPTMAPADSPLESSHKQQSNSVTAINTSSSHSPPLP